MFPTEKELLTMFERILNHMKCKDMFGKDCEFETEHLKVTLKDKKFQLVLFGNFESWQKENSKLKGEIR